MLADVIAHARAQGRTTLDEAVSKSLLAEFGIRVPRSVVAAAAAAGGSAVSAMRPPFAVKVVSPAILHKSDVGGVTLDLKDGAAVRQAIEAMAQRPGVAGVP